jgi:hypothetical protein
MHGGLLVTLFLMALAFFGLGRTAHCDEPTRKGFPPGPIEWRSSYHATAPDSTGQAHVCATGPFVGYTAAHVAEGLGENMEWSYGVTRGRLKVTQRFGKRDLVKVQSDTPFPFFSPLALVGPLITERVYIGGMLWFRPTLPIAYVTFSMGLDHEDDLISQGASMRGSSGACEWAEDGTVVAIHVAYAAYKTEGRSPVDMAVGEPVWGEWARRDK